MRFKLSRPYLDRETNRFKRLVLVEGRIRFTKAKLGGRIVTKKNADEYFYPFVFNPKNNTWYGKSVWESEADEHLPYYQIRAIKFGDWYGGHFNV